MTNSTNKENNNKSWIEGGKFIVCIVFVILLIFVVANSLQYMGSKLPANSIGANVIQNTVNSIGFWNYFPEESLFIDYNVSSATYGQSLQIEYIPKNGCVESISISSPQSTYSTPVPHSKWAEYISQIDSNYNVSLTECSN